MECGPGAGQPALRRLAFGGPGGPLRADLPAAVERELPLFLSAWPWREAKDGAGDAMLRVVPKGEGYRLRRCDGSGETHPHARDAANALAGALVEVAVAQRPDLLCLHAAAVRVAGRLVLAVGESGAGKSSLAMHLAARGHRLFGDDRILVDGEGRGLALGLRPKLRLPLPADAGESFAAYVRDRRFAELAGLAYLAPAAEEAAPFGEAAPLGLVLLPARDGTAPPRLDPARPAEAVRAFLAAAHAPALDAAALVRRLAGLAAAVPARHLRFGASREAALLVERAAEGEG